MVWGRDYTRPFLAGRRARAGHETKAKQANIHTHVRNEVTLVWARPGSPRLAPIIFAVVDWVWLKKYVRVGTEVDATQEGKVVSLSIH